jgi:hypothetical protein
MFVTMSGGQIGAQLGFALSPRADSTSRDSLLHSFLFHTIGGAARWTIIDHGRELSFDDNTYTEATDFRIRRIGTSVFYVIDSDVVYVSPFPLEGTICTGSALYYGGDSIGGGV